MNRFKLFMLAWLLIGQSAMGQTQLTVIPTVMPPVPLTMAEWSNGDDDQVVVTIINHNPAVTTARLQLTLTNTSRNFKLQNKLGLGPCLDLEEGENVFFLSDLSDYFRKQNLRAEGADLEQLFKNQKLPEGWYEFCVQAFSCQASDAPLSPAWGNCAMFPIQQVQPPFGISLCDVEVSADDPFLMVSWFFTPPAGFIGDLEHTLRIVPFDPEVRNANEAMESATAPVFFEQTYWNESTANLSVGDELPLEFGQHYAVQIITRDPDDRLLIENGGRSEVCAFQFVETTSKEEEIWTEADFYAEAHYPVVGDTVPFDFFPIVTKWGDYKNSYRRYEFKYVLVEDGTKIQTRDTLNKWASGPAASQSNISCMDISKDRSQHMPTNLTREFTPDFSFKPGKEYTWSNAVKMFKKTNGGSLLGEDEIENATFQKGMGKPILKMPVDGDTLQPGQVDFKFLSAKVPQKLLPKYYIFQAEKPPFGDCFYTHFYNGQAHERYTLEVSKDIDFHPDSSQFTYSGVLGGTPEYEFKNLFHAETSGEIHDKNRDAFVDEFYKDITKKEAFAAPGTYYWRVRWMLNPADATETKSYRSSTIRQFVIRDTTTVEDDEDDPNIETGACLSECLADEVTNQVAVSTLEVGDSVVFGHFNMKITEVSGSSIFAGSGEIQVPFLNGVRIVVDFSNLEVNAAGKVFKGHAKAKSDLNTYTLSNIHPTLNSLATSMDAQRAKDFNDALTTGNRLKTLFTNSAPLGMPIGIDNEIEGQTFIIGIVSMEFTPRKAWLAALANIEIPSIDEQIPSFAADSICFSASGLGEEGRVFLFGDLNVTPDGGTDVVFKGGALPVTDTTNLTYVDWDCEGFRCLNLAGEVIFDRDIMLPENADGTIVEDAATKVKGRFNAKSCRGWNILSKIDIDPFQIPDFEGWGFKAEEAWLDFSDWENPTAIEFPDNYAHSALNDSAMVNTWHGFWLKTLKVSTPKNWGQEEQRTNFSIANLIIDGTGWTADALAENILAFDDGNIEGWGFAMDTFRLRMVQGDFEEVSLLGKVGMPIMEENEFLKYRATLQLEDSTRFIFSIIPTDTMHIPMFLANMDLDENSHFFLTIESDTIMLEVTLNGKISISDDFISQNVQNQINALPSINIPEIEFQNFKLTHQGFDLDNFTYSLASPQKYLADFPLTLDSLYFEVEDFSHPKLVLIPRLSLGGDDNALAAATTLSINSSLNIPGSGRKIFQLDDVQLEALEVDASVSGFGLKGSIEFYEDQTDEGFRGDLAVNLPMGIDEVSLAAEFGTRRINQTAAFNTSDYYSYWYVNGLVNLGESNAIPIVSGFAMYGFGGGAFYHMSQTQAANLSENKKAKYSPDFNTKIGFRLASVLGTHPEAQAFNMDVSLEAAFNENYGLNYITLQGDGYIMTPLDDRDDPKIWGNVNITYTNPANGNANIHGDMSVFVDVGGGGVTLQGGGTNKKMVDAAIHLEDDYWYLNIGKPDSRGSLDLSINPLGTIDFDGYFMIGHDVPSALPNPPQRILDLLTGGDPDEKLGTEQDVKDAFVNVSRSTDIYENGQGFAFGASLDGDLDIDLFMLYADIEFLLGFDINLTKTTGFLCDDGSGNATERGVNGWYAGGQAYAGIWGDVGVEVDLGFWDEKISLLRAAGAILLQAQGPNPSWFKGQAVIEYEVLEGLVSGKESFTVEIGQKCTPPYGNPFEGIEMITDLKPIHGSLNRSVYTDATAAFYLPVNKEFEVPHYNDDGESLPSTFVKSYISEFKILKGTQPVSGTIELSENNTVASFTPFNVLDGTTWYKARIKLRATERFADGTVQTVMKDGSPWEEIKEVSFKTGVKPDDIFENVAFSYPFDRQRYFLKGETEEGKGIIKMKQGDNQVFRATEGSKNYNYFARFIPLSGNADTLEVSIQRPSGSVAYQPNMIVFPVTALANEEFYSMQLIRKWTNPSVIANDLNLAQQVNWNSNFSGSQPIQVDLAQDSLSTHGAQFVKVNTEGVMQELPGATIADPLEHLLYQFYFRTSQFNTLTEKLDGLNWDGQRSTTNQDPDNFFVSTSITEPFEKMELIANPDDDFQYPLIDAFVKPVTDEFFHFYYVSPPNSDYWKEREYPYVYSWRYKLNGLTLQNTTNYQLTMPYRNRKWNPFQWYTNFFEQPVKDSELGAFGAPSCLWCVSQVDLNLTVMVNDDIPSGTYDPDAFVFNYLVSHYAYNHAEQNIDHLLSQFPPQYQGSGNRHIVDLIGQKPDLWDEYINPVIWSPSNKMQYISGTYYFSMQYRFPRWKGGSWPNWAYVRGTGAVQEFTY